MKKHLIIKILIVLIALIMIQVPFIKANLEAKLETLKDLEIKRVDLTIIKDGTYSGKYGSFPVSATVLVTVLDHKITKIDLVEHQNGKGGPAEVILDQIIEKQDINLDTVSGATYSSVVLKKAVEMALTENVQ